MWNGRRTSAARERWYASTAVDSLAALAYEALIRGSRGDLRLTPTKQPRQQHGQHDNQGKNAEEQLDVEFRPVERRSDVLIGKHQCEDGQPDEHGQYQRIRSLLGRFVRYGANGVVPRLRDQPHPDDEGDGRDHSRVEQTGVPGFDGEASRVD